MEVPPRRVREPARGLARPVSRTILSMFPFLLLLLLVAEAVPVALPVAAAIAWIGAFGLSVRNSHEARALMSKSYG